MAALTAHEHPTLSFPPSLVHSCGASSFPCLLGAMARSLLILIYPIKFLSSLYPSLSLPFFSSRRGQHASSAGCRAPVFPTSGRCMQSPGWHSVLITEAAVGHVWHCKSEIQGLHTRKKYKFYLLFRLLKKRKYFANEKSSRWHLCVFDKKRARLNPSKRKDIPRLRTQRQVQKANSPGLQPEALTSRAELTVSWNPHQLFLFQT